MIYKRCLYYVVRVNNLEFETPYIESFLVVRDYLEAFLNNLPGVPLKWEIEFAMELSSDTNSITIPPYWMAPTKLKDLKIQLKH